LKKGAALMLLTAVVLFGGAVLLHRSDDTDTREQRARSSTVQGSVTFNDMNHLNPVGQGTITTGAVPPANVASSAALAAAASTLVPPPSHTLLSGSQNEEASSQHSMSSDKGYGDKRHRLISLALARAHGGLEKNDLHTARSGVYWALSMQPDNRDALLLKQELVSRERARDATLKAARSCVGQERRQCVWQNASNALSIDSSSTEAQALVKRSNVDSAKVVKPPGF
jgi:hypothetical protein